MLSNGDDSEDISQYLEDSKSVIKQTLLEIESGSFSKLGGIEVQLIAEFSASFDIARWAVQ